MQQISVMMLFQAFLGLAPEKNVFGATGDISTDAAKVRVLVIPTDEELVIARDVERLKK